VRSCELALGLDAAVLGIVADRLAQPRHDWQPFQRPDRLGLGTLFPPED
jgi:hypothetical protein